MVVDRRGRAYVNAIGFDFPGGEFAPGLVAMVDPAGNVRTVAEGLAFPNGMAVTADNATLVVAESYGGVLTAFDIADDVPKHRCARVREGGQILAEISTDLGCFSCALGGPSGSTLFVTAAGWPDAMTPGSRTGQILVAEVDVPAAGWPG